MGAIACDFDERSCWGEWQEAKSDEATQRSPLKDELFGRSLTLREKVILIGASHGETSQDTAERIGLHVETVRSYRKLILVKLTRGR